MRVLHEMLGTWSVATHAAVGVRARVSLPPPPPPVEYLSPAWKLPVDMPALPPVSAPVADKARFLQEAVTMLMIFLDELNAEGDDYIRHSRKAVLLRLEALSTATEAWVREYERRLRAKSHRSSGGGSSSRLSGARSRNGGFVDDESGKEDDCSCSECGEEESKRERRRGGRR